MVSRTEKVHVLYGSQTGNSEQAAQDFCAQVPVKLSPAAIQKMTGTKDEINVEAVHMQLDDFLELERCKWTRLTVIFTSSYGVGQAPLGCYRFRQLCDAWQSDKAKNILGGLKFALCGLGDSKYRTYFQNPTVINETLVMVGAERVGPLGKADASGTGDGLQSKVIEDWIDSIWSHVAKVVAQEPPSLGMLKEKQESTVALCRKINPDFPAEKSGLQYLLVPVAILVLAFLAHILMSRYS